MSELFVTTVEVDARCAPALIPYIGGLLLADNRVLQCARAGKRVCVPAVDGMEERIQM